jgi:GH43 family beta-xylosidase
MAVVGACSEDASTTRLQMGIRTAAGVDGGASRADGGGPAIPVAGLRVEYFDGYHDKVAERIEPNLDQDWKREGPPGVATDRFSARWLGTLTPDRSGKTTLIIDADDGVRLWVDDKLVIDDWRGHFVERHTAKVDLAGPVSVRIDYFELDLDASIKLSWSADTLPEQVIPADRFTTVDHASGLSGPKPPFVNPVIPFDCPDPGVVAADGRFYAACTGGSFPIRTSRDLVRWDDVPNAAILPAGRPAWAANGNRDWAPEIHQAGNEFLAYYTSVNQGNVLSIGVASAPSPVGPYTDRGSPLVEDARGVIDPNFFEDDDGSRWLFTKADGNAGGQPTPIYIRRLAADGLSFAQNSSSQQVLVNEPNTWEGGVVEAPWVVKRNGAYYMFYSGNVYDHRYRTGVARATNLLGPWEKKGSPILLNNDAWVGPGHGSVVRVNDMDYFVYHAWRNAGDGTAGPGGRRVLVDRITWEAGWPKVGTGSPSTAPQPYPGESM